jgi:5'-3' exonuclease
MTDTKSWNDLADVEQADYSGYKNLLLIDANNLSYRWLQRPNYSSFSGEFKKTIQSLAKSYQAARTIVCFDFGKSYYRMELLNDYKGTRKKPETEEEQQRYDDFFAVLNSLPDELDEEVLKFRGVEADDLIAWLSVNLSDKYEHTWIVSSDKDLLQLVSDSVSVFNIFGRKEVTKASIYESTELTPEQFMLSRIIEGDKSDNIIGIEGIGPKRAQALAKEYNDFDTLLQALPLKGKSKYITNLNAGKDTLIRNEKLINLKRYSVDAITAGKEEYSILEALQDL